MIARRRLLAISAAAAACAGLPARATPLTRWQGIALGAPASIHLAHPDAPRLIAAALAEVSRLERVFSLLDRASALSRLNAAGVLAAPPFELLECLTLCARVHAASGGAFDPSVQPLWALHAEAHARGHAPSASAIAEVRERTGWDGIRHEAGAIRFARPGMALTLNGVAQGVIADRVADLLAAEGLTDILVNTGEFRALGGRPGGGDWQIGLVEGTHRHGEARLRHRALATSAPLGTTFDAAGRAGHVLDPRSGRPTARPWRMISISAPRAGLADALSTAACLLDREGIAAMMEVFPHARLEALV